MIQAKCFGFWLAIALFVLSPLCQAQPAYSTDVDSRKKVTEQALRLGLKGEYEQALTALQSLLETAEKAGDKASYAIAVIDSAVICFLQGNYFKALATYQKLPPLQQIEYDRQALAHVLSRRAFLGYYREDHAQALKDAEQSLALFDTADKVERGYTLNVLGLVQEALNNDAQSLASFKESLRVYGEVGDEFWLAFPLNNLGYFYHRQDDDARALRTYQQALVLIERHTIKVLLPYTLNNIGDAHFQLGDYAQALLYLHRSLAAREAKGKKDEISTALRDIGNTYLAQGEYALAIEHYQKSLAIEQALGNKSRIEARLRNIGNVYTSQQHFDLALDYYQKSLAVAEAAKDAEGIASGLKLIGDVYLMLSNADLALDYYKRSLAASQALRHKTLPLTILRAMGDAYRFKGEYEQALSHHQRSLALYAENTALRTQGEAFLSIGETYRAQGQSQKALEAFAKALEVSKTVGYPALERAALILSAKASYAQGDYQQVLRLAERAYELAIKSRDSVHIVEARANAARAYRALGEPEKARRYYDEALALIEETRAQLNIGAQNRQRFFEQWVSPYYELTDLLVEQGRAVEAFAYAERAKGRVLLDLLKSGRANITKSLTAAEQARERHLTNELTALNAQLLRAQQRQESDEQRLADLTARQAQARRNYEDFTNQLYAAHPELRLKRGEARTLNLEQAGTLLRNAQTALLEYVVMDDRAYLFVLTKAAAQSQTSVDLQAYPLPIKRAELAKQIESFRRAIEARDLEFTAPARHLYDLLLAPARAQLQGKTTLVIVPDDALWGLSFQALQPARNRYLLEDAALSYAPSLSVLYEIEKLRGHNSPARERRLLAFGNPAFDEQTIARAVLRSGVRLARLPEAEQEVQALAQLYGAERSRVYTGAAAREAHVKTEAGQYSILHFATHGVFNDASPLYSHLILAQSSADEDGLLEAWEIMKLDLNADLVVLSACETGRGRVGAGEGLIGLSWALFVAGSPTTVVSQWKVASGATRELMTNFHRHLRTGMAASSAPNAKAVALRAAALQMLRSGKQRHPFYWASFILVGASR
jgi:CHAT domain-containing protein/tetratricopeptide (TPR) repeat protein